MNYWLMKSEPDVFSIDDMARKKREPWNGVRNYQARNNMRAMEAGDLVLFYHSSADEIGVAGVMEVLKAAYPDPTQFDKKSEYFDPKSSTENPRWDLVDMGFKEKFAKIVTLAELKANKSLEGLTLLQKGTRLSVISVTAAHFKLIMKMANAK